MVVWTSVPVTRNIYGKRKEVQRTDVRYASEGGGRLVSKGMSGVEHFHSGYCHIDRRAYTASGYREKSS